MSKNRVSKPRHATWGNWLKFLDKFFLNVPLLGFFSVQQQKIVFKYKLIFWNPVDIKKVLHIQILYLKFCKVFSLTRQSKFDKMKSSLEVKSQFCFSIPIFWSLVDFSEIEIDKNWKQFQLGLFKNEAKKEPRPAQFS